MTFISVEYYIFLVGIVILYYIAPIRYRWIVLLAANFLFYFTVGRSGIILFIVLIGISYLGGIVLDKSETRLSLRAKQFLLCFILAICFPLAMVKGNALLQKDFSNEGFLFAVPAGLSFFTIQMVAYLIDIYRGEGRAQYNFFKYALFISFFPQIVQGPIPRYKQLMPQLESGKRLDTDNITYGLYLLLWGFFLKFMIADKAGIIVNIVFDHYQIYKGIYVVIAGILYSLQLYADFQACTKLAQGTAMLFGIRLINNFNHPYFSKSIKEFWGRWHISLSSCLKDYIYIPLGGNRKGIIRKYINIMMTFLVSGMWHGSGFRFLAWGGLHALYQIVGAVTKPVREKIFMWLGFGKGCTARRIIRIVTTFLLTALAWIIFRADSLRQGLYMIRSIFTVFNPWILFNDSLLDFGLDWEEIIILMLSVMILMAVGFLQEKGICIKKRIQNQPPVVRWIIYGAAVISIVVFGSYGVGFNSQDFIYGGF